MCAAAEYWFSDSLDTDTANQTNLKSHILHLTSNKPNPFVTKNPKLFSVDRQRGRVVQQEQRADASEQPLGDAVQRREGRGGAPSARHDGAVGDGGGAAAAHVAAQRPTADGRGGQRHAAPKQRPQ
jgi:hypothetical protein